MENEKFLLKEESREIAFRNLDKLKNIFLVIFAGSAKHL